MNIISNVNAGIRRAFLFGLVLLAVSLGGAAVAVPSTPTPVTSWELTGDFSLTNNTNAGGQAWSYGYLVQSGSTWAFNPFTSSAFIGSVPGWSNGSQPTPGIYQNQAAAPFVFGSVWLPSRHVLMAPSNACERPTVRFTPPVAATYRISGQFYGLENLGGWPASVRINRRSTLSGASALIHQGVLTPGGVLNSSFTSKTVTLGPTDRLDFEVGCQSGVNPFPSSLWTGVHAVIERLVCPPGNPCD